MIAISAILAMFTYTVAWNLSGVAIDWILEKSNYSVMRNRNSLDRFASYVETKELSVEDHEGIEEWMHGYRNVFMEMLMVDDNAVIYDSQSPYGIRSGEQFMFRYPACAVREISFADETVDVYLHGYFDSVIYYNIEIAEVFASVLLFVAIFTVLLRKKMKYIVQLEKEVRIVETGGLEHPFTVEGNDELSALANGLNSMRISLKENIEQQENAVNNSYKMFVDMSHELRTPLTSLILYLDLLSKNEDNDEERHEFIVKAMNKSHELKNIADALFAKFMRMGVGRVPAQTHTARLMLEDRLSMLAGSLEELGYHCISRIAWPEMYLSMHEENVDAVMDAIHADILIRAADRDPIEIDVRSISIGTRLRIAYTTRMDAEEISSFSEVKSHLKEDNTLLDFASVGNQTIITLLIPAARQTSQI